MTFGGAVSFAPIGFQMTRQGTERLDVEVYTVSFAFSILKSTDHNIQMEKACQKTCQKKEKSLEKTSKKKWKKITLKKNDDGGHAEECRWTICMVRDGRSLFGLREL